MAEKGADVQLSTMIEGRPSRSLALENDSSTASTPHVPLRGIAERVLSVPLLGKLAGANLLIVLAALLSVAVERRLHLEIGRAHV